MAPGDLRRNLHFARGHHEQAPVGHGVFGVIREVHQHLLHHDRIGLDQGQARGCLDQQTDVFAQFLAQPGCDRIDQEVEVEVPWLQNLFASEHEELADQAAGALGGVADVLQRAQVHGGNGMAVGEQAGMSLHDGQDVVEVVRHSGCQLAHRLHLLSVTELGFDGLSFRDIGGATMHHFTVSSSEERPRKRALSEQGLQFVLGLLGT